MFSVLEMVTVVDLQKAKGMSERAQLAYRKSSCGDVMGTIVLERDVADVLCGNEQRTWLLL